MPIFLMTFGICMFIVLMQFLWKYVDEMVGKGLEISVLLEMFFYAALSLVPMALPLAILLASLMTFGNLGEQLELLAMKSAGISLPRIMRPFIILLSFVAVGAFFFQNNIIPFLTSKNVDPPGLHQGQIARTANPRKHLLQSNRRLQPLCQEKRQRRATEPPDDL